MADGDSGDDAAFDHGCACALLFVVVVAFTRSVWSFLR